MHNKGVQKMVMGVIDFSHFLMEQVIDEGETVIDATCGNGHDTLYLSRLVGESGRVIAFDIQELAINNTRQLLEKHSRQNVTLIKDSHANFEQYIDEDKRENLGGAIFNLGYLPRSNKQIITKKESTIAAIQSLLQFIRPGGIIVLVVYHGHDGGELEKEGLLNYVTKLNQKDVHVLKYGFINQKNKPPFIIAIQKKGDRNR